jgi:hypothetical protein
MRKVNQSRRKRVYLSLVALIAPLVLAISPASADTNNCNVGTLPPTFSYLNPPDDPTKVAPGTVLLGKLTAYAASPDFGVFSLESKLEDKNSLTTYFFFYSNNAGKTWFCERSYSTMATTELKPNQDYVAIVIASAQGGQGISTVAKFSTKKQNVRICAGKGTLFSVKYQSTSFVIQLKRPPNTTDQTTLEYKVEVSIDGWKTKGTYREILDLGGLMFVKPLSETAVHEFRLVPYWDEINSSPTKSPLVEKYVSTGCEVFSTSAVAKDTRTDCEKNPNLDKCLISFAPGENADSATATQPPAPPKIQAKTKSTITCIKGKTSRKVIAINPKCPAGFKLKV